MKKIKDYYFHKAQNEGYAARSVYKLEEINNKFRILTNKSCVLDLGCSPGSWLQYTSKKVLPKGKLIGIDLKPIKIKLPNKVETFKKNFLELENNFLGNLKFDLIMSDMAPNTTGIKSVDTQRLYDLNSKVLEFSNEKLRIGGNLILKSYQGDGSSKLKEKFKLNFEKTNFFKPKSSRDESIEIFIIGFHFMKKN